MTTADASTEEPPTSLTFKIKTSGDRSHTITILESATVLQLKTILAGDDYEKIPANRQRLIYSGKVLKDEEPLKTYKIKSGNTVHMVKNAQSNTAQNPATSSSPSGSAPRAAAGVPTNMAAGTANDPLAGLTGARYAGHMGLPGMNMFGADGGMGAPPSEDAIASMLDDPNMQQSLNEALNNPAMIDMMIQQTPGLRDNPNAREMLRSPEFRQMMTNPAAIRQAARMRRMLSGDNGGAFPAPGVTDTTPAGAAGTNQAANPFAAFGAPGAGGAANPFASLFQQGQTPAQTPPPPGSAGQSTPLNGGAASAANPFASLFGPGGAGGAEGQNPFAMPGMPPITPEMMRQAMQMFGGGGGDLNNLFGAGAAGGERGPGGPEGQNPFYGPGVTPEMRQQRMQDSLAEIRNLGNLTESATRLRDAFQQPADTRPPEERYADQLRQLNDMGFTDFDRNVEALRRSGGSVQGALEQLLG